MVASEGLGVWGGLWIQVMGDLLLPLMADLARYVSTRYREFPGVCVCVCGVFLMASCIHLLTGSPAHCSLACAFDHLFIHAYIHPFMSA